MYCWNCGTPIRDDGSFCPCCGINVKKRKKVKKILLGLGITFLIISSIICISFCKHINTSNSNVKKTVNKNTVLSESKELKESIYIYDSNDENGKLITENLYDKNGNLTASSNMVLESDISGENKEYMTTTKYEYDSNGNLICSKEQDGDSLFIDKTEYDEYGNELNHYKSDSTGELHIDYTNEYDDNNNLIKRISYDDFGNISFYTYYDYENDLLVEESRGHDVTEGEKITLLVRYLYDEAGNIIESREYHPDLNPDMTVFWST